VRRRHSPAGFGLLSVPPSLRRGVDAPQGAPSVRITPVPGPLIGTIALSGRTSSGPEALSGGAVATERGRRLPRTVTVLAPAAGVAAGTGLAVVVFLGIRGTGAFSSDPGDASARRTPPAQVSVTLRSSQPDAPRDPDAAGAPGALPFDPVRQTAQPGHQGRALVLRPLLSPSAAAGDVVAAWPPPPVSLPVLPPATGGGTVPPSDGGTPPTDPPSEPPTDPRDPGVEPLPDPGSGSGDPGAVDPGVPDPGGLDPGSGSGGSDPATDPDPTPTDPADPTPTDPTDPADPGAGDQAGDPGTGDPTSPDATGDAAPPPSDAGTDSVVPDVPAV
jgi:hypothetical protein